MQADTSQIELPYLRVSLFGDCNFRCIYCPPGGENSYAISRNLDSDTLKRILRKLRTTGFTVVKFTGGEPTLRKDLIDIVSYTSKLFPEVRLITNAWNLTKIVEDLKKAALSKIEISMDAADPTSFTIMTQTSNEMFSRVVEGIHACKRVNIPIQINMVAIRQNLDQVVSMLQLVENLGEITLKILELVYYEVPGYEFWRQGFVEMDQVLPVVELYAQCRDWLYPLGNMGSPMYIFMLKNRSTAIIKDGTVGTTYAHICHGCPMYPCQDGLYGLTLTNDGLFKICKHPLDLHLPLVSIECNKCIISDETINHGIAETVSRYHSAYFLRDGWKPELVQHFAATSLVQPTREVLKWYRSKKYGSGAMEKMETKTHARLAGSASSQPISNAE